MLSSLVIATHNQGKLAELRALLRGWPVSISASGDHGVDEPEETGDSFMANAQLKAQYTMQKTGLAALADDSGLVIPALDGAPGIYSARWAGPNKDWGHAFARIQTQLKQKNLKPEGTAAYFVSALCLCLPDGQCHHFVGEIHGTLTFPPRGDKGFGYDPIFIPDHHSESFAQLDPAYKNSISHRARAFSQFLAFMKEHA